MHDHSALQEEPGVLAVVVVQVRHDDDVDVIGTQTSFAELAEQYLARLTDAGVDEHTSPVRRGDEHDAADAEGGCVVDPHPESVDEDLRRDRHRCALPLRSCRHPMTTTQSPEPIDGLFLEIDEHRLGLRVVAHDLDAVLAPVTRVLVSSERHQPAPLSIVVDPDRPGLHGMRHAMRATHIVRPHRRGQSVRRVVPDSDRLVLVLERDDDGHGTEDLLSGDTHRVVDSIEDGG